MTANIPHTTGIFSIQWWSPHKMMQWLRRWHTTSCCFRWQTQRSKPPLLRTTTRACSASSSDTSNSVHARGLPTQSIKLTDAESKLFDFLLYIQHRYAPDTKLRVAGGWVRDKLRGTESDDIDIVLENCNGKTFAKYITRFQTHRKLPLSSVGLVKANSEKSKHLECATVTIDGHMVDLVHLRAEAYSDDSRIPEATPFAKPADDAMRRDITINALFYNLHTHQVEDFTGKGLEDLNDGIVRTPLEPYQTFLDDPLRVLRSIRFACQFGFTLDDKLVEAAVEHAEIKDAMVRKVSRERIGIELGKMFTGPDPARAVQLLGTFGLLEIVFNDAIDATARPTKPLQWTATIQQQAVDRVRFMQNMIQQSRDRSIKMEETTAAAFSPFYLNRSCDLLEPSQSLVKLTDLQVSKDQMLETSLRYMQEREQALGHLPVIELVERLKVNVKWPKADAKQVALILEAAIAFPELSSNDLGETDHLKLLMWHYKYKSVMVPALSMIVASAKEAAACYHRFQQYFMQLMQQIATKPRMDGRIVKQELGTQAGARIAKALDILYVYEQVYPDASVDDKIAFLHQVHPRLN